MSDEREWVRSWPCAATILLACLVLCSCRAVEPKDGATAPSVASCPSNAALRTATFDPRTSTRAFAVADVVERCLPSIVAISASRPLKSEEVNNPFLRILGRVPSLGTLTATHSALWLPPRDRRFYSLSGSPAVDLQLRRATTTGVGVIVTADGVVLTNEHLVGDAERIEIRLADRRTLGAEIVGRDPATDLAILRMKGDVGEVVPLAFGDASRLRLGDPVLALGRTGAGGTVTMGIVSALGPSGLGITEFEDFIHTDAQLNCGYAGGALVDLSGALIGINTASFSGIGSVAVSSRLAKPIAERLVAEGSVTRGWLGVSLQDVTPALAQQLDLTNTRGVIITDVIPGSAAEEAGIERGDVVLALDGEALDSGDRFRVAVSLHRPGTEVALTLWRSGEVRDIRLSTRERREEDAR